MQSKHVLERQLLTLSTVSALLFALLGIGLGLWMGSLVILFDGAYSLVSLGLTLVSLLAALYLTRSKLAKNSRQSQTIEAAVIAFKGLAITLMCIVSMVSALQAILAGGREVSTDLALLFGVINLLGCAATYSVLVKKGKRAESALVQAESKQWLMDSVISAAVLLGFVVAASLNQLGLNEYAVYADPLMVIIASVYFIIVPVKMVFEALTQLHIVYGDDASRYQTMAHNQSR